MRRVLKQSLLGSRSNGNIKSTDPNSESLSTMQNTNKSTQEDHSSQESLPQVPAPSAKVVQVHIHGLIQLVGQPSNRGDAIDIVAIHGLNGHYQDTWTDEKTGCNWLSDPSCLPKDVPHARILSYSYNSMTYFSRSNTDVRDFASTLLAALRAKRRTNAERRRPLVFICHGLGGLVFKQVCTLRGLPCERTTSKLEQLVVRGHEQDGYYGTIIESIRGVMFMATPHRGLDLSFWDSLGPRIVRAATLGIKTNTKLIKDLKPNSEMLERISDSFAHRSASLKIRSFYETERMPRHRRCVGYFTFQNYLPKSPASRLIHKFLGRRQGLC